jgi:hypothetical protein
MWAALPLAFYRLAVELAGGRAVSVDCRQAERVCTADRVCRAGGVVRGAKEWRQNGLKKDDASPSASPNWTPELVRSRPSCA